MEIVEQIPKEIFVSAHKRALENITRRDKHAYLVGMHTANMKILNKVRKTIVPPMRVYVSEITDKGVVSSNIEYRIQYNHATVPLGHVYGGSGYLCAHTTSCYHLKRCFSITTKTLTMETQVSNLVTNKTRM